MARTNARLARHHSTTRGGKRIVNRSKRSPSGSFGRPMAKTSKLGVRRANIASKHTGRQTSSGSYCGHISHSESIRVDSQPQLLVSRHSQTGERLSMPMLQKPKKPKSLTDRQQLFAEHYALTLNKEESALAAGYSADNLPNMAHKLVNHPAVSAEIRRLIDSRIAKITLSKDQACRVLTELILDKDQKTSDRIKAIERLSTLQGWDQHRLEIDTKGPLVLLQTPAITKSSAGSELNDAVRQVMGAFREGESALGEGEKGENGCIEGVPKTLSNVPAPMLPPANR